MREIKFRAWDKRLQQMVLDINLLSSSKATVAWLSDHGMGSYFNPVAENYQVMQYTGLKDKNGVEIFEGDVTHCTDEPHSEPHVVEYISDDAAFMVSRRNPDGSLICMEWLVDEFRTPSMNVQVIGNIYENPELISNGDEVK